MTMIVIVWVTLLQIFRSHWGTLFTETKEVENLITWTTNVFCIYLWSDGMNTSSAGIILGLGRQKFGTFTNLFSYFCVGLPLEIVFLFVLNHGVEWLWRASAIASLLNTVLYFGIMVIEDWPARSLVIRIREQEKRKLLQSSQTNSNALLES